MQYKVGDALWQRMQAMIQTWLQPAGDIDRRRFIRNALLAIGAAGAPQLRLRASGFATARRRQILRPSASRYSTRWLKRSCPAPTHPARAMCWSRHGSTADEAGRLRRPKPISRACLMRSRPLRAPATRRAWQGSPRRNSLEVVSAYDKARVQDPAYRKLKGLVLALYYPSEPGATQELTYEHVPGAWQP